MRDAFTAGMVGSWVAGAGKLAACAAGEPTEVSAEAIGLMLASGYAAGWFGTTTKPRVKDD